jgi:hypothetical protein
MDSGQISPQPETDFANRTGSWDFVPGVPIQEVEPPDSRPKAERSKDRKATKSKAKRSPDLNHDSFFEMSVD